MESLPVTGYTEFPHSLVFLGRDFTRSMHCYGMILVSLPQVFISSCYLWREVNEEKFQGFNRKRKRKRKKTYIRLHHSDQTHLPSFSARAAVILLLLKEVT